MSSEPSTLWYETMRAEHIDEVRALLAEAFPDAGVVTTREEALAALAAMERESQHPFVALMRAPDAAPRVVGVAALRVRTKWNGRRYGTVSAVAVSASARRHGIGKGLVARAVQMALETGEVPCAILTVSPDNPSLAPFYERCGFTRITWTGSTMRYVPQPSR